MNRSDFIPKGRVMLCNIGRIGDTILSNSILDAAFRTYATVDYLGGKGNERVLRSDSRLNQVIVLTNSLAGFIAVARAALRTRYDGFIGLKDCYSRTNLILARLFRSQRKTGWNAALFRPFDRDLRGLSTTGKHKVEMMRRIGEIAGLQPGEYKPSLILDSDSVKWFQKNYHWDKPFILLNLSATDPKRMWSAEKWGYYVQGCGFGKERILINGLPRDQSIVQQLCQKLPGGVAFKPRQFQDVSAAVAGARMVLTVDTGVVHACSALNKPVVALYSSGRSAIMFGPLSTRCCAIQAQAGGFVSDIDPQQAIVETKRSGLARTHST